MDCVVADNKIWKSWLVSNNMFISWRIFASIYVMVIVIVKIWDEWNSLNKLYEELTHWSLILTTSYLWLALFSMICRKNNKSVYNILITLQDISSVLSVVVVISYWAFIRNPPNLIISIHTHGISSILNVLDLLLCENMISFTRSVFELSVFSIVYALFTLGLAYGFDTVVYKQLRWKSEPFKSTIFLCTNLMIMIFVLCILYIIKWYILSKINKDKPEITAIGEKIPRNSDDCV
eukprot:280141_1